MTTDRSLAVERRLAHLWQHLGLAQAHVAARTPRDWQGFATATPERIASLTLVCPQTMDGQALRAMAARCLLIAGDQGAAVERAQGTLAAVGAMTHVALQDYLGLIWDDAIADHPAIIGPALLAFLRRMVQTFCASMLQIPVSLGAIQKVLDRVAQAIEPHYSWRKRSHETASTKGNRWVERILSLKETCRLQDQPTYAVLVDAVTSLFAGRSQDLAWLSQRSALQPCFRQ